MLLCSAVMRLLLEFFAPEVQYFRQLFKKKNKKSEFEGRAVRTGNID